MGGELPFAAPCTDVSYAQKVGFAKYPERRPFRSFTAMRYSAVQFHKSRHLCLVPKTDHPQDSRLLLRRSSASIYLPWSVSPT